MAEPSHTKNKEPPTPQNTPASATILRAQTQLTRARQGMEGINEGNATSVLEVIQSRLGDLNGESSGYIESLPKAIKDRVAGVKGLRAKQAAIEADFHREVLELEKKYLDRQKDLYTERRRIIAGEAEPTPEDIESGEAAFEEEKDMFDGYASEDEEDDEEDVAHGSQTDRENSDEKVTGDDEDEEDVKGIPNFWLTAFRNVPHLTDLISDRDSDVITYLIDVRLKYLEKPGFALDFEFSENPYFSNKVLTKSYLYHEEIGLSGEFMYDHAEGADIKWSSPEHNVTVRVEQRKQRNKHTKATRTIEKTLKIDSFFNFFSPPALPDIDEVEDEYAQNLQSELDLDFELGEFFKEKLIPRAVDWFTGRAIDYEGIIDANPEDEDFIEESGDEDDEESGATNLEDMKKDIPESCKQQ